MKRQNIDHLFKSVKITTQSCFLMRMFQSVSGHSSEQSIANHSSQPTDLRIVNHRRQTFPPSLTLLSFKPNAKGWPQPQVFRRHFFISCIFKATSKLFRSQGCSDDQIDLTLPVFSLRFVDFAVQFCFRCKFSSMRSDARVRCDSGVIFQSQSQFFATHSKQCRDCFILSR